MGYFYIGGKTNNSVNGYLKIGETNQKQLSKRIALIRYQEGNFVVFKYLDIPGSTPAMTRAIEGHVRFMMERDGWNQVQNDHFTVDMRDKDKAEIFQVFTASALKYAEAYCQMVGITYEVKDGDPKAKRNHKPRKKAA